MARLGHAVVSAPLHDEAHIQVLQDTERPIVSADSELWQGSTVLTGGTPAGMDSSQSQRGEHAILLSIIILSWPYAISIGSEED